MLAGVSLYVLLSSSHERKTEHWIVDINFAFIDRFFTRNLSRPIRFSVFFLRTVGRSRGFIAALREPEKLIREPLIIIFSTAFFSFFSSKKTAWRNEFRNIVKFCQTAKLHHNHFRRVLTLPLSSRLCRPERLFNVLITFKSNVTKLKHFSFLRSSRFTLSHTNEFPFHLHLRLTATSVYRPLRLKPSRFENIQPLSATRSRARLKLPRPGNFCSVMSFAHLHSYSPRFSAARVLRENYPANKISPEISFPQLFDPRVSAPRSHWETCMGG